MSRTRAREAWLVLLFAVAWGGAAAGRGTAQVAAPPQTPVEAPPRTAPAESLPAPAGEGAEVAAETAVEAAPEERPPLRDLCRFDATSDEALDTARRRLRETFCTATLWFDSLFGSKPDVANARAVSGRLEGSGLWSEAEGSEFKGRLRLRYDLPNLDRRVNLFLGRGDEQELIEDRYEGLPIRSAFFGLVEPETWLGGLGYAPPGAWASKLDFRVGLRLKSASELFVQGRYRRNFFHGERSVVRLRETAFYSNREEGFGFTSSVDVDHLLDPSRLLRVNAVATFSQGTEGVRWRGNLMLFRNLERRRAVLWQAFVRGETAAEVPLEEYGAQAILRLPFGRPWIFAHFTGGYSWPRFELEEPRDGSVLIGFALEIQVGDDPQ